MMAFLSVVGAVITIVAFIKSGFEIDLYGLPAELHARYSSLRDKVFEILFFWLPWIIPIALKDFIASYFLMGFSYLRAKKLWLDRNDTIWVTWNYVSDRVTWDIALRYVLLWPFYWFPALNDLFRKYFGPGERLYRPGEWEEQKKSRTIFMVVLSVNCAAAAGFFFWNYLESRAGI